MDFSDYLNEFFAVEKMTARMVNNIDGPIVDGRSVFGYIYLLLALIAIAWVCFSIYQNKKPSFESVGLKILIIILGFWIALEARSALNYLTYFNDDSLALSGKSLSQKRALTSPVGMYDFVELIESNVPAGEKIELLAPKDEYINIKLGLFLQPKYEIATSEAKYIAGYLMPPQGYKYFANTQYGWIARK